MKEVIKDKELREVIRSSTNLICDAVSSSLGPSGNNVIINTFDEPVFITNDGVTIAKSIEVEDKKINTVLEIIKEASLKTDEKVGDGTTTTLVLLQSILNDSLNEIENGKSPIVLKKEIEESLKNIINELNKLKRKPTKEDFINIASISSNDKNIGNIISEVYFKMKNKYSIRIEENNDEETYYKIQKGYSVDIDNIPTMYFENKNELILKEAFILILHGYLNSFEEINEIVNESLDRNKNIVIFVEDYDENLSKEAYLYNLKYNKNIFIFKVPNYGSRKEAIEKDLSIITNSNIKDINLDNIYFEDLGLCEKIIIRKDNITLINSNENIKNRVDYLKGLLLNIKDDYEKEFIEERISKLEKGIATIYIGGITKTEKKEKIMRYIDALNALEVSKNGIITGEGISLLKVSEMINNITVGDKILKNSLKVPFKKIINNVGEDYESICSIIEESKYNKVYNFDTKLYEDYNKTKIIDPINVVIEALKNSCSIASMLFTTNYLVINEKIIPKDVL